MKYLLLVLVLLNSCITAKKVRDPYIPFIIEEPNKCGCTLVSKDVTIPEKEYLRCLLVLSNFDINLLRKTLGLPYDSKIKKGDKLGTKPNKFDKK